MICCKNIILEYLEKNDCDGLCDDFGCFCEKDNLFLCEGSCELCQPAKKVYCVNCLQKCSEFKENNFCLEIKEDKK
jgi:hypothetical protein